jgi:hypothetical protein
MAALVLVLALAGLQAHAQPRTTAGETVAMASPPTNPTDQPPAQPAPPLSPDESALLSKALVFDPTSLASTSAKALHMPGSPFDTQNLAVTRTDQADGSSTVVIKKPLSTEWNANIGADLGMGPSPTSIYQPTGPIQADSDRTSGAAWATLGLADLGTVNARVDPTNDQGVLGTTFQRSIPVGGQLSMTLQNTSSLTRTFSSPAVNGPAGLPVMALAAPGSTPSDIWGDSQAVTFNILPTGTTLAAGVNAVSSDPVTHNSISADQKLFGPLHVTTAVTDVGESTISKSITAGFKFNW